MTKNALIAILLGICLYLSAVIVTIENQRYALQVGLCKDRIGITDLRCLETVKSRTSWWWHLYYAITD